MPTKAQLEERIEILEQDLADAQQAYGDTHFAKLDLQDALSEARIECFNQFEEANLLKQEIQLCDELADAQLVVNELKILRLETQAERVEHAANPKIVRATHDDHEISRTSTERLYDEMENS